MKFFITSGACYHIFYFPVIIKAKLIYGMHCKKSGLSHQLIQNSISNVQHATGFPSYRRRLSSCNGYQQLGNFETFQFYYIQGTQHYILTISRRSSFLHLSDYPRTDFHPFQKI